MCLKTVICPTPVYSVVTMLETPYLNDLRIVVQPRQAANTSEKDAEFFSQKHCLKCESCHWTTSYIDATGYLDISGEQVQCPTCKKGIIEDIETSCDENDAYVPPSHLGFVLTDW